jgi:AcrR family transcriptional regulator
MTDDALHARVVGIARALLANGNGGAPSAAAVAAAVGVSRSSYYRLAGGSHRALLRAAGHVERPPTRERILDATAALLEEVGLAGLLMDAVAGRAGVSRPTLYRLFPGKAELFAELARRRAPLAALGPALAAVADRPPEEVLPALVAAAVPRLLANRGVLRAVLAEATTRGPESGAGWTIITGAYAALADYLRGQMAAGRLRRTDPLAAVQALLGPLLLYAVVRPDFWAAVAGGAPAPEPERTLAAVVQIWLRGLRPDPGTATGAE